MSGRGDNNKNGTSGQGAGNQSNQRFAGKGENKHASNHRKKPTGNERSKDQPKSVDSDAHRGEGHLRQPPHMDQ